jgi:hypothetical protein
MAAVDLCSFNHGLGIYIRLFFPRAKVRRQKLNHNIKGSSKFQEKGSLCSLTTQIKKKIICLLEIQFYTRDFD